MKSIRLHGRDGRPENLFYEEAPAPQPAAGEVLIRVRACAITKSELTWPEVHRAEGGGEREFVIPGHEVSGVIDGVPDEAGGLKEGDEIYALVDFDREGAAAELVTVPAAALALKPLTLNYVEAAAVPLAGLTAWQGLFDYAQIASGQKILIHGAAGGVGCFAVQFARLAGAYVICTAQEKDEELLLGLGADEVLDYKKIKFEEVVKKTDIVFDTVGGETLEKSWPVLRAGGTLVTVHTPAPGEDPVAQASERGVRGIMFIVKPNSRQLAEIGRLIDDGAVKPVIDKVYPLAEARAAFEHVENGPNRGKVVLQIG